MLDGKGENFSVFVDILNHLKGMFYRCNYDKDRTITFVTKGCKQLTGYDPEDLLLNKTVSYAALVHPKDAAEIYNPNIHSLQKRVSFDSEYRIIDKQGMVKTVWERATGIYDSDGNLKYIEGFITEATDIKEKEELRNELLLYRKAIDINTICTVTNAKGDIIYANQKFCEVSKYNEKELVGSNHRIINSGYHQPEFFRKMWTTIRSGNVWRGEIKNKAKDGTYYWVDTIIIPVEDHKGAIHKYLSLRTVITERKAAEEQIQSHVKSMEQMLFMISHELRKPIATSIGLSNLLKQQDTLQPQELEQIFDGIQENIYEIDIFSRKLNDFIHENKIETSKQQIN